MSFWVYILTNKSNSVLYIGKTDDLHRRWQEHLQKVNPDSFIARYNIDKLVYYEKFQFAEDAAAREKQLKGGSRQKKIDLIQKNNPLWNDLSSTKFNWEI